MDFVTILLNVLGYAPPAIIFAVCIVALVQLHMGKSKEKASDVFTGTLFFMAIAFFWAFAARELI